MGRLIRWASLHGWTLLLASLAFLGGMAVMLPMGWQLDGSAANLIGGIVGAVATIGGALLLWQVQEQYRTRHLAKAIAMQFGSIFPLCEDLWKAIPGRDSGVIGTEAKSLLAEIELSKRKVARFDQSLHLLPSEKIAFLLNAEMIVDTTKTNAERAKMMAPLISGHPTLANTTLDDVAKRLRQNYLDLGEELDRFAPNWSKEE